MIVKRFFEQAFEKTFSRYIGNIDELISRSEERVDRVNNMVRDLIGADRAHIKTASEAVELFRIASEAYTREIAEMREYRHQQEITMQNLQEELRASQREIDRLIAANGDMLSVNQTLVSNLTKLNINVRS